MHYSVAHGDTSHEFVDATGDTPVLLGGETFTEVAESRGVPLEQVLNPKQQDSRAIKHHGPNPHYGARKRHKANGAPVFVKSGRVR